MASNSLHFVFKSYIELYKKKLFVVQAPSLYIICHFELVLNSSVGKAISYYASSVFGRIFPRK